MIVMLAQSFLYAVISRAVFEKENKLQQILQRITEELIADEHLNRCVGVTWRVD